MQGSFTVSNTQDIETNRKFKVDIIYTGNILKGFFLILDPFYFSKYQIPLCPLTLREILELST